MEDPQLRSEGWKKCRGCGYSEKPELPVPDGDLNPADKKDNVP
jgi:rubredoxin